MLFFHPPTKQLLTSATYKLDPFLPAGPQFNLKYDGTFVMTSFTDLDNIHFLPTHQQGDKVFVKSDSDQFKAATVLHLPLNDDDEPYVIQFLDSGDISEVPKSQLLDHDPSAPINNPTGVPFPTLIGLNMILKLLFFSMIECNILNRAYSVIMMMNGIFIQDEPNPNQKLR